MSLDASMISYIVHYEDLTSPRAQGIGIDHFVDEWRSVYRFIHKSNRDHDSIPSVDTVLSRFPDIDIPRVRRSELSMLVYQLKQRKKYISFLESLNQAASSVTDYEQVDEVIQQLQGELNTISYRSGQPSHLVDLFTKKAGKSIRQEVARRRRGEIHGIKTGLDTLDRMTGGLQKQKMITVIGRSGLGKSWVTLFLVANAVISGKSVIIYPLEMTLFETAARLYTIFSQEMFGGSRTIKNFDITSGNVTNRKLVQFFNLLEDKFAGQLLVADVGSLSDPYTNERIEAEVEAHKPDMFWVDYITLLKGTGNVEGHELVRKLSNGVKNTAMRRNVVGGASAQVNREAIKANAWLPRLEHIAYGDAIGQDSDAVVSIGRDKGRMYYSLVKNRGGPEFAKIELHQDFNLGIIREAEVQEEVDDDD